MRKRRVMKGTGKLRRVSTSYGERVTGQKAVCRKEIWRGRKRRRSMEGSQGREGVDERTLRGRRDGKNAKRRKEGVWEGSQGREANRKTLRGKMERKGKESMVREGVMVVHARWEETNG